LNYLIDTNVLSELSKKMPNQDVVTFVNALPKDDLYISVITLGEIIKGIEKVSDVSKKGQLDAWHKKVRTLFDGKIIDIDEGIITAWGKLVGSCSRTLPAFDSLIAATCIYNDCILLTRNEKDFDDIPNITIQNPWKTATASQ
jgi:predicted nucleic acid-binding protein